MLAVSRSHDIVCQRRTDVRLHSIYDDDDDDDDDDELMTTTQYTAVSVHHVNVADRLHTFRHFVKKPRDDSL